jgi:hypothetical protein
VLGESFEVSLHAIRSRRLPEPRAELAYTRFGVGHETLSSTSNPSRVQHESFDHTGIVSFSGGQAKH